MTDRDNVLWLQCWRDQRIDSNQLTVNPLLTRFWPNLQLAPGSRVFVPLCGASLDLIWFAEQGYDVIGVELSPIAIASFFTALQCQPIPQQVGQFSVWEHGRLKILCGDFFALSPTDLGTIDLVYDRAALTALPEEIRPQYVAHLTAILDTRTQILLLTIEDAEVTDTAEQVYGIADEIKALYAETYSIELLHVESLFENNPEQPESLPERAEYKVYLLNHLEQILEY